MSRLPSDHLTMVFFPKFFGFFNGRLSGWRSSAAPSLKKKSSTDSHCGWSLFPRKKIREDLLTEESLFCVVFPLQHDEASLIQILVPWVSRGCWMSLVLKRQVSKGTPLSGLLQILVGHTLLAIKRYKNWLMMTHLVWFR